MEFFSLLPLPLSIHAIVSRQVKWDWLKRGLGYSQEYLDRVRQLAAQYDIVSSGEALLDTVDSDSGLEAVDGAPLSPPPTPTGSRPDLAQSAQNRPIPSDLAQRIEPTTAIVSILKQDDPG